jgi:cobalt-zinc-cadmium resistance protein CzcA
LKSALAVKIYGPDLNVLQNTALEIKRRLAKVPGFTELTVVRELGQPSLLIDVDRDKIARYGINVADVEAIVQAAVGGQAATQVIQGEKLFDLVVRMKPEFRENAQQIGNLLVGTPQGSRFPERVVDIHEAGGASFIYRENNSRYIGVQYSMEGRDLQSAVNAGQRAIADITKTLPPGYRLTWGGEYGEFLEAKHQMELSARWRC